MIYLACHICCISLQRCLGIETVGRPVELLNTYIIKQFLHNLCCVNCTVILLEKKMAHLRMLPTQPNLTVYTIRFDKNCLPANLACQVLKQRSSLHHRVFFPLIYSRMAVSSATLQPMFCIEWRFWDLSELSHFISQQKVLLLATMFDTSFKLLRERYQRSLVILLHR